MSRLGRRQRFGAFTLSTPFDSNDVPGDLLLAGNANLGLNATVVSPTDVPAVLSMVGGASLGLAAGITFSDGTLAMVGGANLALAGVQIHAGVLNLVGGASLKLVGTGGSPASVDPATVRSGIVAIGIRGGHS